MSNDIGCPGISDFLKKFRRGVTSGYKTLKITMPEKTLRKVTESVQKGGCTVIFCNAHEYLLKVVARTTKNNKLEDLVLVDMEDDECDI